MRGAVLYGPRDIRYVDRADPRVIEPTDAIVRILATCVCGSDLWDYRGIDPVAQPTPMGHEYCGIVEEVGYEGYWTGIQNEPEKPAWITGSAPTPAEIEWARFAAHRDFGSLAEHELPPRTRRNRRSQAAAWQGHLSRRRCSDYGEPDRCRAGERTPAPRLSADRR